MIKVETIGYKFRVFTDTSTVDIVSTTELGMAKSNEIIRNFFDNFMIIKSEKEIVDIDVDREVIEKTGSQIRPKVRMEGAKVRMEGAKVRREAMKIIWGNLRDYLGDEFTLQDYIKALKDAGYKYTKSSWDAVPSQQIRKLIKLSKLEKIEGVKRVKYRKLELESDKKKSLKNGEKPIVKI